MEQNKHKTSQGEVWMDTDGILHQAYPPGTEINMEDSLQELEIYKTHYCKEKMRPIIVDISNVKKVSKESRDIYSSEEMGNILTAAALIVNNPVSRILGNFYMGISKTKMPIRIFSRSDEAKKWLVEFLP